MDFTFPEYPEPTAIDAQRSWTATFESYNQRKDDVYYVVTIHEAGRQVARFIVLVWPQWKSDDWSEPGFVEHLHQEIHKIAVTGKTNTSYIGAMSKPSNP